MQLGRFSPLMQFVDRSDGEVTGPGRSLEAGSRFTVTEMCVCCLWTRLGRTRSDMICITCAIRRLYAALGVRFFTFQPLSPIIFLKIVFKATSS